MCFSAHEQPSAAEEPPAQAALEHPALGPAFVPVALCCSTVTTCFVNRAKQVCVCQLHMHEVCQSRAYWTCALFSALQEPVAI